VSASFHVLHQGYVRDGGVASTVTLVLDHPAVIVVDPGMVADRALIIGPLADHGLAPEQVTHVVLTHHHPDHSLNMALFPEATVVDFWASYRGDQWVDHPGEGHQVSPHTRLAMAPGHTHHDLALLVATDAGVVAITHAWWDADGPEVDPLADDQAALEESRRRILSLADLVVPGHGAPFPTGR
jgi:glyoxylase-like metal-dependent hydrolase (beta-lactamase superfamily II)